MFIKWLMRNDTIFSNNNNERRLASLARICYSEILPEKQTLRKNVKRDRDPHEMRWWQWENDDDENDEQNRKSSKVIWFRQAASASSTSNANEPTTHSLIHVQRHEFAFDAHIHYAPATNLSRRRWLCHVQYSKYILWFVPLRSSLQLWWQRNHINTYFFYHQVSEFLNFINANAWKRILQVYRFFVFIPNGGFYVVVNNLVSSFI